MGIIEHRRAIGGYADIADLISDMLLLALLEVIPLQTAVRFRFEAERITSTQSLDWQRGKDRAVAGAEDPPVATLRNGEGHDAVGDAVEINLHRFRRRCIACMPFLPLLSLLHLIFWAQQRRFRLKRRTQVFAQRNQIGAHTPGEAE